ncbi:hypothetical protein ACQVGI_22655, partial [Escherichia coli]|uniref:hypothetical protein n=1 Tax=Escherichia coli TaxID=562 RepID=UPI003D16F5D1
ASTLKSPSYTKSVSWQHYQTALCFHYLSFAYALKKAEGEKTLRHLCKINNMINYETSRLT